MAFRLSGFIVHPAIELKVADDDISQRLSRVLPFSLPSLRAHHLCDLHSLLVPPPITKEMLALRTLRNYAALVRL